MPVNISDAPQDLDVGIGANLVDQSTKPIRKVFATPFRLIFVKTDTQDIHWIEVKTLDGLKNVVERIAKGELTPTNAFNTLDRQLWGHLAEYCGFLRTEIPGAVSRGIQPIGAEQAQLVEDMEEIFGDTAGAFKALSEMRKSMIAESSDTSALNNDDKAITLKDDGINLTKEGEEALVEILHGDMEGKPEVAKIIREQENAEIIGQGTDDPGVVGDAIAELDAELKEAAGNLVTITGEEAEEIGKLVEEAGMGELRPNDD